MKNALVLHGTDATSQDNWFPWLTSELAGIGYTVWTPDLPQANKPNIKRYNEAIFANKSWTFSNESIIIGHSSGAVAILGLLQALPDDVVIEKAILVSPFTNDLGWDSLKELFVEPFDYEKIKKHASKFIIIHSDNDPYIAVDQPESIADQLEAEFIVIPGQGHFSLSSDPSYNKFPFLLELLNK